MIKVDNLYSAFKLNQLNKNNFMYCTSDAKITFYELDSQDKINPKQVLIHSICIDENSQRKGMFSELIHQLIKTKDVDSIGIVACSTFAIHYWRLKWNNVNPQFRFDDYGGDYIWNRIV